MNYRAELQNKFCIAGISLLKESLFRSFTVFYLLKYLPNDVGSSCKANGVGQFLFSHGDATGVGKGGYPFRSRAIELLTVRVNSMIRGTLNG
jgi:hypothetical protein